MALSDDQRALLRLLAQREEGYEDIAALMGLSVEEVRARVRSALAELDRGPSAARAEGASAAGPVAGQGSSSSQAAGEEPSPTPPAAETPSPAAEEPLPRPTPGAPVAEAADRPSPPAARRAGGESPRPPFVPRSRRRLLELAGGALVVLLLILFATGAIDIGGGDDSDGGNGRAAAAANGQLTQAALEPVGGGDAEGRALFGRVGQNPVLQIQAQGLEPSSPGQSYTVWLYRSPKLALRVGAIRVGKSGRLGAQLPVPLELLGFVANGSFKEIRVSLVDDAAYKAEVAAAKRGNRLPPYAGETVLAGEIEGPALKAQ